MAKTETNGKPQAETQAPAATTSAPSAPWKGKTKTIKVSVANGPAVEVQAPDFETIDQAKMKVDGDSSLVSLINQAYTVALQAGARRELVKDEHKTDEDRRKAVQRYVDGYTYGVRQVGTGEKRVSAKAVGERIKTTGVQFSAEQLEALRAAGIEV